MTREEIRERDILGHVEAWPTMPYPDGVSVLRDGDVCHYYPHTAPLAPFALGVAEVFYGRIL